MPETEDKKIQTVPSIKVEEDYSVTVVNKASLLSFFKEGANLDGLYNVVQAKARALVADVTTADGVSKIKSTARQIASIKKRVDDIGKVTVDRGFTARRRHGAIIHLQPLEDGDHMLFDRAKPNAKLTRNILVDFSSPQQCENLALTLR